MHTKANHKDWLRIHNTLFSILQNMIQLMFNFYFSFFTSFILKDNKIRINSCLRLIFQAGTVLQLRERQRARERLCEREKKGASESGRSVRRINVFANSLTDGHDALCVYMYVWREGGMWNWSCVRVCDQALTKINVLAGLLGFLTVLYVSKRPLNHLTCQ